MTYKELVEIINSYSDKQKEKNVTLYDLFNDEYIPVEGIGIADNDVVEDTPVINF